MKVCVQNPFLCPGLMAGLGLILAGPVTAQTFTTLYSFTGGSDGVRPEAGLILSGNTLFGTTYGNYFNGDNGTVFAVNTDGTGFTTLYGFSDFTGANSGGYPINS